MADPGKKKRKKNRTGISSARTKKLHSKAQISGRKSSVKQMKEKGFPDRMIKQGKKRVDAAKSAVKKYRKEEKEENKAHRAASKRGPAGITTSTSGARKAKKALKNSGIKKKKKNRYSPVGPASRMKYGGKVTTIGLPDQMKCGGSVKKMASGGGVKREKKKDQYGQTRKEARGTRKLMMKKARRDRDYAGPNHTRSQKKELRRAYKFKPVKKK